jgi:hypothetical protein
LKSKKSDFLIKSQMSHTVLEKLGITLDDLTIKTKKNLDRMIFIQNKTNHDVISEFYEDASGIPSAIMTPSGDTDTFCPNSEEVTMKIFNNSGIKSFTQKLKQGEALIITDNLFI